LAHLLEVCIRGEVDEKSKDDEVKQRQLYRVLFSDEKSHDAGTFSIGLGRLAQLMASTDSLTPSAASSLEQGACVCMTLLPICSSTTVHSCLPNCHFSPCIQSEQLSYDAQALRQTKSGLPSSTFLKVQLEAIRDFYHSESADCADGEKLSVAIVPYILQSRASREEQLHTLLQPFKCHEASDADHFSCNCPRCQWESGDNNVEEWLTATSPWVQLSLANHYMQEGEKGGGSTSYWEAARCYVNIISHEESRKGSNHSSSSVVLAMAYHALGAAMLNLGKLRYFAQLYVLLSSIQMYDYILGDWFRARCIWLHASQHSLHYEVLQHEIIKCTSYPLIRLKGNLRPDSCKYAPAPRKADGNGPNVYLTCSPIISAEECQRAISLTEEHAAKLGSWTTSRHYAVPTTDIPIHTVPTLLEWFNGVLKSTIGPLMHAQYTGLFRKLCI
jgi:hypothetical protein